MLTIEQLATALGHSTRHIQRLQADGLPYIPTGKRAKRYDLPTVKAWLQERYTCQSGPAKAEDGKSPSASTMREYTDACRRVQLRVTPAT